MPIDVETVVEHGNTSYRLVGEDDLTLEDLAELLQWIVREHGEVYRTARILTASGCVAFSGSVELYQEGDGYVVVLE